MADKKLTPMMEHLEWLKARMVVTKQMEKELLEKERQMVVDAALFAYRDSHIVPGKISQIDLKEMGKDAEQYYNETFKTN